ncbi:MAG TPA: DUF2780 domain-containing protein [Steroidobacteraceae bacterium]|jgi:hypothetical protein|nr:DUF2780 domain-containing protein [Steroidobacteraceae bacterium]
MHRRIFLAVLSTVAVGRIAAANPLSGMLDSAANPLLGMLTSKLGVSQDQAEGGVGSILKLAQEKLVKGDFDKVAAAIPGASRYLEKAKTLGAFAGAIGNKDGLMAALGKLGISSETAAQFLPLVTNFVSKSGGSKAGNLLKSVLA